MAVIAAHMRRAAVALSICALLAALSPATQAAAQESPPAPPWLEPRGLAAYEMVGQVDEEELRGAIIVWQPGGGLLIYEHGTRSGDEVEINVRVVPTHVTWGGINLTRVGCLGQAATYDTWPVASPAARTEIFAGGVPVHALVDYLDYYPAGLRQPVAGSRTWDRYSRERVEPDYAPDGSLALPPNLGCSIVLVGRHENVTARFRLNVPQRVLIETLGKRTFTAESYIGPGAAGMLTSLMQQMDDRFGPRDTKSTLAPFPGTNLIFVRFPPAVDPYVLIPAEHGQQGGGTYRFALQNGGLSVDRINSMGIPLHGEWQDADQVAGDFLPYVARGSYLSGPEYILPPDFTYDACMTDGGCPDALLEAIYSATYEFAVYYHRVTRVTNTGLARIPLRQAGPDWDRDSPALDEGVGGATMPAAPGTEPPAPADQLLYLPLIAAQRPEEATGCPCGWFDADGAMIAFVPPLE